MASPKGGSGKTILAATFAAFLSNLGKRVLLVDTDAATNGLTLLYLKEVMLQAEYAYAAGRVPRGVYEDLTDVASPEIVKVPTGVDLIPATFAFTNPEHVPVEQFSASLRSILERLRTNYDYIFLDAQAGADLFAQVAMSRLTAHEVVIVSEYDPLSAAGVERLKGLLREDLTYVRTWVLLNKMLPDFVQSFSDFLEVAKYASPIPWDADVVRAYARRRLALDLEKGNEFTLAILQTLRSLFGDEIGEELRSWLELRAASLREPIETQYHDAERELEGLMRERYYAARRAQQSRLVLMSVVMAVPLLGMMSLLYFRLTDSKFFARYVWLLPTFSVAVLLIMVLIAYMTRALLEPRIEFGVRDARFRRQEDLVQERLKKLESLRQADLETLLRHQRTKASD